MPNGSSRAKNLAGMRFGRLIVIKRVGTHSSHQAFWECECDCGTIKNVPSAKLIKGATKSCGCLGKEIRRKSAQKEPGCAAKTLAYQEYKKGARRRNITFSLTKDQFLEIVSGRCFYCGCESSRTTVAPGNNGSFTFNGIDRVNNNDGYVAGNCVPCCYQCNRAKMDVSHTEFLDWIRKVYSYAFG